MTRFLALSMAYLFLAFAAIGVFLPGVPTVPFLLLAAWFAARSSERLHRWLYAHPRLGNLLRDWEQQRAIPRASKVIAVAMLTVSGALMYQRFDNAWALAGLTLLFLAVAAYLISRPEPE